MSKFKLNSKLRINSQYIYETLSKISVAAFLFVDFIESKNYIVINMAYQPGAYQPGLGYPCVQNNLQLIRSQNKKNW